MRITEARLRKLIREELESAETSDDRTLDLLSQILGRRYHRQIPREDFLQSFQQGTKMKLEYSSRPDLMPAVDIMVDVIKRANKPPKGVTINQLEDYYIILGQQLARVNRKDVAKSLPPDFDIPEGEDPSFSDVRMAEGCLYLFLRAVMQGRDYVSIDTIERFANALDNLKADPDIMQTYLTFFDTMEKFIRFFGSGEYKEYEEQIINLLNQGDFRSIIQAASLVDMLMM